MTTTHDVSPGPKTIRLAWHVLLSVWLAFIYQNGGNVQRIVLFVAQLPTTSGSMDQKTVHSGLCFSGSKEDAIFIMHVQSWGVYVTYQPGLVSFFFFFCTQLLVQL